MFASVCCPNLIGSFLCKRYPVILKLDSIFFVKSCFPYDRCTGNLLICTVYCISLNVFVTNQIDRFLTNIYCRSSLCLNTSVKWFCCNIYLNFCCCVKACIRSWLFILKTGICSIIINHILKIQGSFFVSCCQNRFTVCFFLCKRCNITACQFLTILINKYPMALILVKSIILYIILVTAFQGNCTKIKRISTNHIQCLHAICDTDFL